MRSSDGLDAVLRGSFSRRLLVDVLHGTDRVASEVSPLAWSLSSDLGRDPKTTGTLRFVHQSLEGESWVPRGTQGVLSPFKATLVLTEEITVGGFQRRVQLGMFDVVSVPFARDYTGRVGARWVQEERTEGDIFPVDDVFPVDDEFPGEYVYGWGNVTGGYERVLTSVVEVEVASLDQRVLDASFRSPVAVSGSAWGYWKRYGILPVVESVADASIPRTTWPAEAGSRLDAVQHCARLLGGVPVVDSFGQWVLVTDDAATVELHLGEFGTVIDLDSELTTDGFFNVVVGDYESESGRPIRAVWEAPGALSPELIGDRVRYHSSDMVRTQASANQAVASVGELYLTQELDVRVTCVTNPLVEIGDRVEVVKTTKGEDGSDVRTVELEGVARSVEVSDGATMTVVVRVRRSW